MRRLAVLAAILTAPVALAQTAPHLAGLSSADYVLSRSGETFVLKNGRTGAVSSGSDARTLLQSAINTATTNGTVTIALGAGEFALGGTGLTIGPPASASTNYQVTIRGAGRQSTKLTYSGTGAAITIGTGSSPQTSNTRLEGFALRQVGTPQTGKGIDINGGRETVIRDVSVGTLYADLSPNTGSNPQNGFEYGLYEAEIGDWITIDSCEFYGNLHAVQLLDQSNNSRITNSQFINCFYCGSGADGILVGNSANVTIDGNRFHFYGKDTAGYGSTSAFAIKAQAAILNLNVTNNYFEANSVNLWLNDTGNISGVRFEGNYVNLDPVQLPTPVYGIYAGLGSVTYSIDGIVIKGNNFNNIGSGDRGIYFNSDVKNWDISGNSFTNLTGTSFLLQATNANSGLYQTDSQLTLKAPSDVWLDEDTDLVFEGATADDYELAIRPTDPTADRTITLPDASGTLALASDAVTVATQSDSQGMQFYPSRKRSAAMAIAAKKRGDTKFASPTTNPVVIIGDSIMATASQAAWRIWDERFRAWGLGFDPLVDCDIYHGNFTLKTETWGGTWAFRHVGTLGCLTASAPSNATEWGLASQSATADDASDTLYYGWAHPIRANRARIWYAKKPGGGHFEYRANGGSWTDVDTANATLDAGSVTITLSASILLEGVVEVRWASGGSITLWGIETYAADTVGDRIEFQNTLPYWLTAGGQSLTGTATDWESYGNSNTPLQTFLRTVLPSQIIVTLGTNDACLGGLGSSCSGGYVTADDEETALRALVASLSSYMDPANKGDIVLATALPRGTHGSGTESATVGPRLDGYRQRIFEVARDLDLSVWDLRRWWPTFAEADSGALNLYDDGTHPSPTGKALLMRGMTAWLDPDPWKSETTGGLYCGAYSLSSGAVIWPECTFGTINSSGTFHTLSSCDYKHNFGRNVEVFCGSGATWDIDADSTAGNVRAGADFACGTNKAIRLTCDGVNWRETGRSFATTTATTYLCETFGLANNPANATTYFFGSDGGSVYYWPVPIAGTLSSMACTNNAQLSAGSGTITAIRYDGTLDATDLTVSYTTTETAPTKKSDTACTSNCAVASTDMVAVRIAADASYAPTTADWACTVCMTVP